MKRVALFAQAWSLSIGRQIKKYKKKIKNIKAKARSIIKKAILFFGNIEKTCFQCYRKRGIKIGENIVITIIIY
jgi:hypothetical protein